MINVDPGSDLWNRVLTQLSKIYELFESLQKAKRDAECAVPLKAH